MYGSVILGNVRETAFKCKAGFPSYSLCNVNSLVLRPSLLSHHPSPPPLLRLLNIPHLPSPPLTCSFLCSESKHHGAAARDTRFSDFRDEEEEEGKSEMKIRPAAIRFPLEYSPNPSSLFYPQIKASPTSSHNYCRRLRYNAPQFNLRMKLAWLRQVQLKLNMQYVVHSAITIVY